MTTGSRQSLTEYPIRFCVALALVCILQAGPVRAQADVEKEKVVQQESAGTEQDPAVTTEDWPEPSAETLIYQTGFPKEWDSAEWTLLGGSWQHKPELVPPVLSLFQKKSDFKPPHRSPFHMAMLNRKVEGDFVLEVTAKSTHEDYGHRDVCFYLGFVDPGHFYYVHLARNADPHANQIFIVNGEDRKSISLTTTEGTLWDDNWHKVRIRRTVSTGDITVWFDDLENPVMTANDKTFQNPGQVGVGSFDDTADYSMFRVYKYAEEDGKKEAPAGKTGKGSSESGT